MICDLIDSKRIATAIRESAEHVLTVALAREGIEASPEKIRRLAKEIGNNAAAIVAWLETDEEASKTVREMPLDGCNAFNGGA